MSGSSSSSGSRRESKPHIRLNSNPNDLLTGDNTSEPKSPLSHPTRQISRPRLSRQGSLQSLYNLHSHENSKERLLPPKKGSKFRRYRDEPQSPSSGSSSRRSSMDSTSPLSPGGRFGPYAETMRYASSALRSVSGASSQDGDVNTQTVSEKYNILPSAGLLVFPEDVEKDDWLHNPLPGEKEDRECHCMNRRGVINIGGLVLLITGVLLLFIGYPVVTWVNSLVHPHGTSTCANDPDCIKDNVPILKNVRTGLIDPDTPDDVKTRVDAKGKTQKLVFSDEFNTPGRTFYPDDDAYFQGVDLWYGATEDLEWYDPDALVTGDGVLNIKFDQFKNHGLNYRSGMLQSWNQMCFKSGYIEASISLPGAGDVLGFWPGFWTMGNLGRPGYLSTTDGMWPYTYWDHCDYGITANQSSTDGISFLPGMKLPACTCNDGMTPSPGKSRSAPEIDAIEASTLYLVPPAEAAIGSASQSFQLAPFDVWYQPDYDFVELYDERVTMMNLYKGAPQQQSFSGLTNLNNDWFDGKAYQTYAFEYQPGAEGYVTFYVGQDKTWMLDGRSLGPNGNVGQRTVPEEPMAIVTNFGMSKAFSAINMTGIEGLLPATMRVDYIRIYQDDDGLVTCDPPGYETTDYIAAHPKSYRDTKKTRWEEAGYEWPTNSFVNGC